MRSFYSLSIVLVALLLGCAPAVIQVPTSAMTPLDGKHMRLSEMVEVGLSTGYTTVLKPQTTWHLAGRVDQGEIYKTRDQVVTVEGSHIHEAYLVVRDGHLVGFYLPVEQTFSPLSRRVKLPLEDERSRR